MIFARTRSVLLWGLLWIALFLGCPWASSDCLAQTLTIDGGDSYTLSKPDIVDYGMEMIGDSGIGVFMQSGGSNYVTDSLHLGRHSGSEGAYTLSGGSLNADSQFIGYDGDGVFTQAGGSNTARETLYVGSYHGSSGVYNLQGGELQAQQLFIGNSGTGAFNQTGGSSKVGVLNVGDYYNANDYTNGHGALLDRVYVLESSGLILGGFAPVVFSGGGGVIDTGGIGGGGGSSSGSSGSGSSSGSSSANSGGCSWQNVGFDYQQTAEEGVATTEPAVSTESGMTRLSDAGGPSSASGSSEASASNSNRATSIDDAINGARYSLQGGVLEAENELVGVFGSGAFVQTGGSNTVQNNLYVSGFSGYVGVYDLEEGNLFAGTVYLTTGGTFIQSGGSLNVANFNQFGGEAVGSLENRGEFSYQGGSFNGRLLNYGAVHFNADFTAENGLENYSALNIPEGRTVTLNGRGLDNQGDMVVDGVMAGSGPLLNNANGTVSGHGSIVGDFSNSGVVAPGGSIGVLSVVGSYTQTETGVLEIEVASPTSYDRVAVSGNPGAAVLNGVVKPSLTGNYIPAANQVFAGVVNASGGVSGTFSTLANARITPTLVWQPVYNADSFDLLVLRDYANPELALTPNQQATANMLNSVATTASGDLNTVLSTIDNLQSNAAVADAYQQLSPEKASALPVMGFAGSDLFLSSISRRITDLRLGAGGTTLAQGLQGSASRALSEEAGKPMLAYNSSDLAGLLTEENQEASGNRWGLFVQPVATFGDHESSASQTGFEFTTSGFTAGLDYRLSNSLLVGLATGYAYTDLDYAGSGGGVEGNTWPITGYLAYLTKPFYLFGSLGYAVNFYDLERKLTIGDFSGSAQSSPVGHQLSAYGEAGYDVHAKNLVLTPLASVAYSSLWIDGYTEDGPAGLEVSSQSVESLKTGLGARIVYPFKWRSLAVAPQLYTLYQHEFSNDGQTLNARFAEGGAVVSYKTDDPERDYAVVGGRLTLWTGKRLELQLDYNAEVGRGDYASQSVNVGARWEF